MNYQDLYRVVRRRHGGAPGPLWIAPDEQLAVAGLVLGEVLSRPKAIAVWRDALRLGPHVLPEPMSHLSRFIPDAITARERRGPVFSFSSFPLDRVWSERRPAESPGNARLRMRFMPSNLRDAIWPEATRCQALRWNALQWHRTVQQRGMSRVRLPGMTARVVAFLGWVVEGESAIVLYLAPAGFRVATGGHIVRIGMATRIADMAGWHIPNPRTTLLGRADLAVRAALENPTIRFEHVSHQAARSWQTVFADAVTAELAQRSKRPLAPSIGRLLVVDNRGTITTKDSSQVRVDARPGSMTVLDKYRSMAANADRMQVVLGSSSITGTPRTLNVVDAMGNVVQWVLPHTMRRGHTMRAWLRKRVPGADSLLDGRIGEYRSNLAKLHAICAASRLMEEFRG